MLQKAKKNIAKGLLATVLLNQRCVVAPATKSCVLGKAPAPECKNESEGQSYCAGLLAANPTLHKASRPTLFLIARGTLVIVSD